MSELPPEFKEKLEPYQMAIYNGLKSFRDDIADFYFDGVRIFNSHDFRTKSNLLGHCAREIDDGLRDILSPKKEQKITKENLMIDGDHIASILTALNCDLNSEIAVKWFDVSKQFHKYAHLDKKRRKIKDPSKGEKIWRSYEKILLELIGTYYNFLNRVDRILSFEKPSKNILDSLDNLFENNALYTYFFTNLKSPRWLKSLKDRGYFDLNKVPNIYKLRDNPITSTNLQWLPLFYLKNIAVINKKNPNKNITNLLIEIINSIINNYDNIDNNWIDSIVIEIIGNFPADRIEDKHIEIIRTILRSPNCNMRVTEFDIEEHIFPALIKGQRCDLILHLLNIIFDFHIEGYRSLPIVDEHWLNETLKEYKTSIIKLCGLDVANIILEILKKITASNPYFRIQAIDDNPQNILLKYDCIIVHFLRDIYETSNPKDIKDLITDLLTEDAPIFKRLSIYLINYHYSKLKNLFWNLQVNPLNTPGLRHEIYVLLKNHFTSFNDEEIEKLIKWIEDYDYYVPEDYKDNDEEKEVLEAIGKLKWLDAVKKSENSKIQQVYLKYKKKYPEKLEHPDFDTWFGKLEAIEDFCPKELYEKSNQEIAEYLNEHERKEVHSIFKDSGISLKECVKNNPDQFTKNLNPFLNVSRVNQHELLDGLLEALRDGKDFEWDEILDYIKSIIYEETFWKEQYSEINYRDWIIARIADIILEKTRNDDNPFKMGLLFSVSTILIRLAEKTDSELYPMGDIVTSVLNSPNGKIYLAMLNFSLSYARLYRKDDEEKWYDSIKLCIEKKLNNPPVELSVVLGEYLRFVSYIDKNWIIKNIDKIFSDAYWEETFAGYIIYHANPIYEEIYKLIKDKGYYDKAIKTDFKDKEVTKSLVYQICSAYSFDYENLTDRNSLILKLIQRKNSVQLSEIIRFFLVQKKGNYELIKPKIKPIWKVLFDLISQNPDNFQEVIDDLVGWLVFFDEIDGELFKWLIFSTKHIKRLNFFIVENLLNCIEKSPKEVATIFIEIISNGTYPEYKKEYIIKIVETLYEKGEKESADKICNLYGANNMHFLRPLYDQHNKLN